MIIRKLYKERTLREGKKKNNTTRNMLIKSEGFHPAAVIQRLEGTVRNMGTHKALLIQIQFELLYYSPSEKLTSCASQVCLFCFSYFKYREQYETIFIRSIKFITGNNYGYANMIVARCNLV